MRTQRFHKEFFSLRRQLSLVCWLFAVALLQTPTSAVAAISDADVLGYTARLDVDISTRTITGHVVVDVKTRGTRLHLDSGDLQIDTVRIGRYPAAWRKEGTSLVVTLPPAATRHHITIAYHGSPKFGLEFHPERGEAYTIFSTSQWMPSIDAPHERATLDLTLITAPGLQVVASGEHRSRARQHDGRVAQRWVVDRPRPAFLYAFAMAPYRLETAELPKPALAIAALSKDAESARALLAGTRPILAFMQDKAGIPYPGGRYSQVVVADTIGQEAAGMTLLSADYAADLASGRDDDGLVAHELAHQWWGASLTCRDWGHFWLNEGFATYMTAAWMEHSRGRAAYLQRVAAWRSRIDALKQAGNNHPLVFSTWKPTADNRAVAYQKGALFLHTLREMLGDEAFWRGVRAYTQQHAESSVTTADFRRAMEQSSGQDLGALFATWTGPVQE